MRICVLCEYTFPEGMAPTTRILAYTSGLVKHGVKCDIVTFAAKDLGDNGELHGCINGVDYYYCNQRNEYAKKNIIGRIIRRNNCILRTAKRVVGFHHKSPYDYVLFSFDKLVYYFYLVPIFRLFGIKLIFIGDEYPEPIRQLKNKIPEYQRWLYKIFHTGICARILMTENLKKYYNEVVSVKKTHILSSIVDSFRFYSIERQDVPEPYLCYMGNMMLAKDNVDNIIRAFSLIADKYPDLKLYLYGMPNKKDLAIVSSLIKELHLENRALIKGRIAFNEVPQILANATILVTSQPQTKRAQGGFPTKMCEYMMADVPTVLTTVGEIPDYVQDGVNGFLVPPCNPELYAEKLDYILQNKDVAKQVSRNAYYYVESNFCKEKVTDDLKLFLTTISKH